MTLAEAIAAGRQAVRDYDVNGSWPRGGNVTAEIVRGLLSAYSQDKSAQPCGCDRGANYQCEQHRDSTR